MRITSEMLWACLFIAIAVQPFMGSVDEGFWNLTPFGKPQVEIYVLNLDKLKSLDRDDLFDGLMKHIQDCIDNCKTRDCEINIDTTKYELSALKRARKVLEQNNFNVDYNWARKVVKIKYKL